MKRALLGLALLLTPTMVVAAPVRCSLDTSNPAITHNFIPVHGGGFQGVTGYNDPSEWPFLSFQSHWACPTCNGMAFDDGLGFLNPATTHIHLEICFPYLGDVNEPIIVPFQLQAFHLSGTFYFNSGPMALDAVWDEDPTYYPWHQFQGDPMGVVKKTGHFRFNPRGGDGGPNIHSAAPNGWTIMMASAIALLNNGDTNGIQAEIPIFTHTDLNAPFDPDMLPNTMAGAGISSVPDGGSPRWGSQISEVRDDTLPLLGPFNTQWDLPHLFGYMYGGSLPVGGVGTFQFRKDMDLHGLNGPPTAGIALPGAPLSGSGAGYLDPVAIGTGKHKIALVWQAKTGPDGAFSDGVQIGAPNETATALLVFNVEVGNVPPPPTTCQDPNANNFNGTLPCTYNTPPPPVNCAVGSWLTTSSNTVDTDAITSADGSSQSRTETTVSQQSRPITAKPANGGLGCPVR